MKRNKSVKKRFFKKSRTLKKRRFHYGRRVKPLSRGGRKLKSKTKKKKSRDHRPSSLSLKNFFAAFS